MATTVIVRENPDDDGVTVTWHQDEMPAFRTESFESGEDAYAAYNFGWHFRSQEEEYFEDYDNDIVAVAVVGE